MSKSKWIFLSAFVMALSACGTTSDMSSGASSSGSGAAGTSFGGQGFYDPAAPSHSTDPQSEVRF